MNQTTRNQWIALFGRRDQPVDGVRDYCRYLAEALEHRGIQLTMEEVQWAERGWPRGLAGLWRNSGNWKGRWALFQYTALAWSRHGFPFPALAVMAVLRFRGVRTAVVFHDWTGYTGPRLVDRVRWNCQLAVMRRIARLAHRSVLPAPPEKAAWLPPDRRQAAFIAIGANLPTPQPELFEESHGYSAESSGLRPTVGVYCMSDGRWGSAEAELIASTVKQVSARLGDIRLIALGRGSEENRPFLERALSGSAVELSVLGLVSAEEAVRQISRLHVALFVRGEMEGQRGSAIASIACGTPLVGFGSPERAFPLSEAGVVFVPKGDRNALAEALSQVLSDAALRQNLRERSRRAKAKYFSWDLIAQRFAEVLADR